MEYLFYYSTIHILLGTYPKISNNFPLVLKCMWHVMRSFSFILILKIHSSYATGNRLAKYFIQEILQSSHLIVHSLSTKCFSPWCLLGSFTLATTLLLFLYNLRGLIDIGTTKDQRRIYSNSFDCFTSCYIFSLIVWISNTWSLQAPSIL